MIPDKRYLNQVKDGYGWMESLAGSSGIARRTKAGLEMGEVSILSEEGGANPDNLTAEEVLSASCAGDKLTKTIVTETVDLLSVAITNLISIVDPERSVIIIGELAKYGDLFLDPIRTRIQGKFCGHPEILLSDLKMDAAVLSAVMIVMRFLSSPIVRAPSGSKIPGRYG